MRFTLSPRGKRVDHSSNQIRGQERQWDCPGNVTFWCNRHALQSHPTSIRLEPHPAIGG
jgi:hypothetical protein